MNLNEFLAVVEFLGENMTDTQADELMDKAKEELTPGEISILGHNSLFYNGKLYSAVSEYEGECGRY